MTEKIKLTCTNFILPEGKNGILRPDDEGYYVINAGGFNIENRSGITYPMNDYLIDCMTNKDSEFGRRLYMKQMYGEMGHPEPYYKERLPNGDIVVTKITQIFEWIQRLKKIDVDNYCMFIDNVYWEYDKSHSGIIGPVLNSIRCKPIGAKGNDYKTMLDDPNINSCVSIRTIVTPTGPMDRTKNVEYFVTYDVPFEQGMLRACKYLTEGLEGFNTNNYGDYKEDEKEKTFSITGKIGSFIDKMKEELDNLNRFQLVGAEDLNGLGTMIDVLGNNLNKNKEITLQKSILTIF